MLQKYSRYRILQEFFDFPLKDFQMREISRRVGIAQTSVTNHLKSLVSKGLIIKQKKGIYPSFNANRDNELFRLYRKSNIVQRIQEIGLLDYLWDNTSPDVIILFGSASKGDDIESSDIDLFVQAKEKKIILKEYEKKLNREISLFFEENFSRLSSELKNNILNGIMLKGYIKIF